MRVLKETLALAEERRVQCEQEVQREEGELAAIDDYLRRAQSDLELQVRIKQGQVELSGEKPVPEL